MCMLSRFSCIQLFVTPWTVAYQAPLSMRFSRQENWSGLPWPPAGNLPDSEIEPVSLTPPALVDEFFTTSPTWKAPCVCAGQPIYSQDPCDASPTGPRGDRVCLMHCQVPALGWSLACQRGSLVFYRMRECSAEASTHSVWLAGLSMGLPLLLLSFGMMTGLTRGDQWKKRRVPWVLDGRIEEDGARGHF